MPTVPWVAWNCYGYMIFFNNKRSNLVSALNESVSPNEIEYFRMKTFCVPGKAQISDIPVISAMHMLNISVHCSAKVFRVLLE